MTIAKDIAEHVKANWDDIFQPDSPPFSADGRVNAGKANAKEPCQVYFRADGGTASSRVAVNFPRFQMMTRGSNYTECLAITLPVVAFLRSITPFEINGSRYRGIELVTETIDLGSNEADHYEMSTNFRAMVCPPDRYKGGIRT